MILKLFKPSWRKLLITACLYGMVGFSSEVDKAARKVAREDLTATALGQSYSDEVERIYKEVRCEAHEQVVLAGQRVMEEMRDQNLTDTLEFKASFISGLLKATLIFVCYILACIACTGAVIRLREKPDYT